MILNTFSLQQAEIICEQYQYLVSKPIESDKSWLIDCVAVAPSDSLNQWVFAHFYMDLGSPIAARAFYTAQDFSVIAISIHNRQTEELAFKDISLYLCEQEELANAVVDGPKKIAGPTRIVSIEEYRTKQ